MECANGGTCNNGQCLCPDGIERPYCKKDTCLTDLPCEHGDCVYGICECDKHWVGRSCDSLSYINHEGYYYGGFICDSVQSVQGLFVLKTDDLHIFEIREPEQNLRYSAYFWNSTRFNIIFQNAMEHTSSILNVEGEGRIKDGWMEMEITYRTRTATAQTCAFEGQLNP